MVNLEFHTCHIMLCSKGLGFTFMGCKLRARVNLLGRLDLKIG